MNARIAVDGTPTGGGRRTPVPTWRQRVAAAASGSSPAEGRAHTVPDGLALTFTLPARRWVDLDTIAEETLAGLRDAGVCRRGFAGLDALVAVRRNGDPPGAVIEVHRAAALRRRRPPGPVVLDTCGDHALRARRRDDKRAWRRRLADAWAGRPIMSAAVWVDLELRGEESLLGPLEPALDGLEPILGRDPRGRAWQEFFPNDHRIRWLRVTRGPTQGPQVRLRLGPIAGSGGQAMDSGGAAAPA